MNAVMRVLLSVVFALFSTIMGARAFLHLVVWKFAQPGIYDYPWASWVMWGTLASIVILGPILFWACYRYLGKVIHP